jgi:hypothetical protein
MVQILCIQVCKCKKWYLLKLFQEWVERGIKESGGEGKLKHDKFHTL